MPDEQRGRTRKTASSFNHLVMRELTDYVSKLPPGDDVPTRGLTGREKDRVDAALNALVRELAYINAMHSAAIHSQRHHLKRERLRSGSSKERMEKGCRRALRRLSDTCAGSIKPSVGDVSATPSAGGTT